MTTKTPMSSRKQFFPKNTMILALLMSAVLASAGLAAEVKAVRVKQGPKLDGALSDPVWQEAVPFSAFKMAEPKPNQEPTERTEVRIIYDDSNLYIGVLCLDSEPSRISANSLSHDNGSSGGGMGNYYGHGGDSAEDDLIRVLLDPFQDKRKAYIFFVNPRGARGEGLITAGSASLDWDGIWGAESRILKDGWSAEFKIPFKTLSFNPGLTVWGVNVERVIARKQEKIRLSGTNLDSNFYNPMEAADLAGIAGFKQGHGITVRPYGLASALKDHTTGESPETLDGGVDIYKNFTPNLVGVFSYRMDFAETEVDERRINLTRFSLYFPEKRMFFLEGSDIFSFSSSISFTPFFSRTVGLYEGRQIPITFGAKLFGKVGKTSLALLDVQTGSYSNTDAGINLGSQNFLAARITQDIFAESKVGLVFTNGSPSGEKNTLAGLDFRYSSSKFLGNKNIMLAAWGVYNWNETDEGRHHGFGFRADYPNDLWNFQSTYAYYGEALDPGMGYLMRKSIQTGFARLAFQPRPRKGWLADAVRQFYFEASADYYWDLSGNLESYQISLSPLSFRTESGEQFSFQIEPKHDVLPANFEVAAGVVLPPGAYNFTSYQFNFESAGHRKVTFDAGYTFGQFYSGHYDDIQGGVTLKYKGYLNLGFETELVRGRLPEGRFHENVYQLKADIFLSADLGLMNYIQYDNMSHELGWSARLRWRISPGNEIYFVYNQNWEKRWDPTSRFYPLEQKGVIKISLSIRP